MNLMKSLFGSKEEIKFEELSEKSDTQILLDRIAFLEEKLNKVVAKLEKVAGPIDG